jgi:hypothetical protein
MKFFFYDQDHLVITNLPVYVKLLYKVCSQSYYDVIIKSHTKVVPISGLCATPPSPCWGRHSKVGHFL